MPAWSTSSPAAAVTQSSSSARTFGYGEAGEPQLGGVVEPGEQLRGRGRDGEQQQPAYAEAVVGLLLVGGGGDPQADRAALVDQRREAVDLVAGPRLGEGRLDRAEGPGGLAGRAQPGLVGDLAHRPVEGGPQRLLERLEVLADPDLGAGVVEDAEGRPEVRRAPCSRPRRPSGTCTPVSERR